MVEHNLAKDLINHDIHNYSTDVMTGDRNKRMYLYNQLALRGENAFKRLRKGCGTRG